jgi:hypothetical protein
LSIRLMQQVWDLPIRATEKMVLLSLADQANDDGVCWPSVGLTARRVSRSDREVQRAIRALVKAGVLIRSRRYNQSSVFKIVLDPASIKPLVDHKLMKVEAQTSLFPDLPPAFDGVTNTTSEVNHLSPPPVTHRHPEPPLSEPKRTPIRGGLKKLGGREGTWSRLEIEGRLKDGTWDELAIILRGLDKRNFLEDYACELAKRGENPRNLDNHLMAFARGRIAKRGQKSGGSVGHTDSRARVGAGNHQRGSNGPGEAS